MPTRRPLNGRKIAALAAELSQSPADHDFGLDSTEENGEAEDASDRLARAQEYFCAWRDDRGTSHLQSRGTRRGTGGARSGPR
jgi:hypothetical protein